MIQKAKSARRPAPKKKTNPRSSLRASSAQDRRRKAASTARARPSRSSKTWQLRLYVAGQSPKSLSAIANLKKLCEEHLQGKYEIELVDLLRNPQLAARDQIVALPSLVRKLPSPIRRIVGDLSNAERTLVGLQLRALPA